jgi:glycosyltransferase involved in cell wall biosynthesis
VASPYALLLLPRPLGSFILRELADDLLRAPGVGALAPGRVPYGVLGRLPDGPAAILARRLAARLRFPGPLRAVVVFHPFQWPLAHALLERHPGAELWYCRWDRYEAALDADPRTRRRLEALHAATAARADLVFTVSGALADLERTAGRSATLVPTSADGFPAPDPGAAVVAVSFGHHGRRVDWALLRAVTEGMPELVVLVVGEVHPDQMHGDADFEACRRAPGFVWLGWRSEEEAARLIACADIGLLPFKPGPFNDAGLPNRILKAARLGRRTVAPPLAGVRTWEEAVVVADGPQAWIAALRAARGVRARPDPAVRDWALAQTAERQDAPLWERLAALGIA